jgi:hypothetical protein
LAAEMVEKKVVHSVGH